MSSETSAKYEELRAILGKAEGIAVAFSGGVDSTFLAAVARDVLGRDKVLGLTAVSPTYPRHELQDAVRLAESLDLRHEIVDTNELAIPGFADNPPDRCYHCKKVLFGALRAAADRHGLRNIADGSNLDDMDDYRPGRRAAAECGVMSPLADAGMGKADIRELSRMLKLPTAGKPSFACLASRFPYGSTITEGGLKAVARVEDYLRANGFDQVRVRHHGNLARIEVEPGCIDRFSSKDLRDAVVQTARDAGFIYVTIDLMGYRTGSMNETLGPDRRSRGKE